MENATEVTIAFDLIVDELEKLSTHINKSGAAAMEKGQYTEAEERIAVGKNLRTFREKVYQLSTEWRSLYDDTTQQPALTTVKLTNLSVLEVAPVRGNIGSATDMEVEMKLNGITAKGIYKGKKILLLKGSFVSRNIGKSLEAPVIEKREELINKGVLKPHNKTSLILQEDISFSSPTAAARFVAGYPINGLTAWKESKTGQSLKEIK